MFFFFLFGSFEVAKWDFHSNNDNIEGFIILTQVFYLYNQFNQKLSKNKQSIIILK